MRGNERDDEGWSNMGDNELKGGGKGQGRAREGSHRWEEDV